MPDKSELIKFHTWEIELIRRPYRKSMSIQLKPHQRIRVVANATTDRNRVFAFLTEKKSWIEKHLARFEAIPVQKVQKRIQSKEEFLFLGSPRKVKFVITPLKKYFVSVTDEYLQIHWPMNEWSADIQWREHPQFLKMIQEFYKREGIRVISEIYKTVSDRMGCHAKKITFRGQRSRWGSCSSKGHLSFNWKLIFSPRSVIEYVVVHELCHLIHMNHSEYFWNMVQYHCPEYRDAELWLKNNYLECEFLAQDSADGANPPPWIDL